MREMSVFDVIGPAMIGPSSSHTAGALRIALLTRKLLPGRVARADFLLHNSFARTYKGHGTDRALVGGMLGFAPDDLRIRDSFGLAREAGLDFSFATKEGSRELHPNTVDITAAAEDGQVIRVRGASVGGGSCLIQNIDGVEVSLTGDYNTLIIRQRDTYGVVAFITKVLTEHRMNIAYMHLYRESRGSTAYSIIELDGEIPPGIGPILEAHGDIRRAMVVSL